MTRTPDYEETGHPGVWPNGELPEARDEYDQWLAKQSKRTDRPSYPVERTR